MAEAVGPQHGIHRHVISATLNHFSEMWPTLTKQPDGLLAVADLLQQCATAGGLVDIMTRWMMQRSVSGKTALICHQAIECGALELSVNSDNNLRTVRLMCQLRS